MELWTAFTIGLFGSLHCVGMCGPIALALPGTARNLPVQLVHKSIYNIGRTVTYSLLGGVVGAAGYTVSLAGLQRPLSVLLGILILLFALYPLLMNGKIFRSPNPFRPLFKRVQDLLGRQLKKNGSRTMLLIGLINGLLPCGFVYVGLAGSLTRETVLGGMGYMALFGLGTIPAMMLMAIAPDLIALKTRRKLARMIPYFSVLLGCYLIYRGIMMGTGPLT